MHRQFLNAEPALFTLLLHRLSPESLLLLCFPLDLILYPGSSQRAPPPPILWHSLRHIPSFAIVRSRGGGNQSVICTGSTTNRSSITCAAALGLPTTRTTSAAARCRHLLATLSKRPARQPSFASLTSPTSDVFRLLIRSRLSVIPQISVAREKAQALRLPYASSPARGKTSLCCTQSACCFLISYPIRHGNYHDRQSKLVRLS